MGEGVEWPFEIPIRPFYDSEEIGTTAVGGCLDGDIEVVGGIAYTAGFCGLTLLDVSDPPTDLRHL